MSKNVSPAEDRGYWYGGDDPEKRATAVLEALRLYRAAESAMRRRTRSSMAMGENELLVLRFITKASSQGEVTTPVDLARYLGVTTASITALVDRLERSGHLQRLPHPTDRRKVVVTTTDHTNTEIRETLGEMHRRMHEVARTLSPEQAQIVIGFLSQMVSAVDHIDAHAGTPTALPLQEPSTAPR